MSKAKKSALIVVDVQRDFCEGGALAASDTLSLLAPLQQAIEKARRAGATIVFTKDWHPASHNSFSPGGGPWPVVVFAHGYNTTPGAYATLTSFIASEGYIVAAPAMPGERSDMPGTPTQGDIPNEPHDLSSLARKTFHCTSVFHACDGMPFSPVVRMTSGVLVGMLSMA